MNQEFCKSFLGREFITTLWPSLCRSNNKKYSGKSFTNSNNNENSNNLVVPYFPPIGASDVAQF